MKICTKCGERRRKDAFRKSWGRSSDGLRPLCRDCQKKYEKFWRANHQAQRRVQRVRHREKADAYRYRYIEKNRAYYLVSEAGRRCRKRGAAFDLDQHIPELNARIAAGKCEMSGVPFRMAHGKQAFNSPSIDRICPEKGYVYQNIRVVCWAMNAALGSWGEEKLRLVMKAWLREG